MMYKSSLKSIAIAFSAMCLMASCQKSVKGKWTDADKEAFAKEFKAEIEKSVKTDKNLKMFNIVDADIKAMSDCSLAKIEAKYTPEDANKKTENANIEKIGEECSMAILLGKKGAWTAKFKDLMKVEMDKEAGDGLTAEQKTKLVECIISKAEQEIEPKDLATSGEKMGEIGTTCGEALLAK